MKSRLIAALLTAAMIAQAGAANVAKTYSYFSIGGSTLAIVKRSKATA